MVKTTSPKIKKIWPQLTEEQKNARREKFIALTNDIEQAHTVYSNKIENISKKHGRSERWTSCQLFISRITRARCQPTAWNGFVSERLNDINEKLPKGSHWKLTEFIASHWETLQHDFMQLMEAHKFNHVTRLMQESVQRKVIVHYQPKAVQCKMSAAFETMDKEWTSLCTSLGIEGFYIVVCGVEDLSAPKIFFSLKGDKFVHSVLDLEPCHLALKFESFVVSGLADKIDSPAQCESCPLNKLISDCCSAIQKGLDDVLRDNGITRTVCMNYSNYKCKITECFGVELIGWPNDLLPIHNPAQLGGHDRVQKLLSALTTKVCHWKKLSEEDT
ncbi:hypothetical protein SCLCIDRAFT_29579 [Scleroderma citrinum Foug A]|uniref:Uncharacterized protein n=1 Tax=Scleroderma citrinum Foug A TaxID=1036808 RepID=A0A0C3DJN0_9AGAM|nr:hypothetical protein SCLCIDRAFT_29579 [Scleroderma citrinum Foug A]